MHSRKIVSFSRNAISSIRSPACKTVMTYPTFVPTRFISETSFAKDMLKKQGEKLEPAPQYEEGDYKFVVDQTVYQPTEKVLRVVDSVLELDVVEIQMFVLQIQKRLGISNEMLTGMFSGGGGGGGGNRNISNEPVEEAAPVVAEPVKERDAFDLKLTTVDAKSKIKIIKEIRSITGLGLKEAKDLVEKAPVVVKEGVSKEDAEKFKAILIEAGAGVELL